ncbi:hypothetical protein NAS141_01326 [Sulfitobacter sp. NAS-14.1]|nr:hypothetical protein NAS141_01326 [Sulfitobacter sp. NAS-14.1]
MFPPLADNTANPGGVIIESCSAKFRQQLVEDAVMAGDRPFRQSPMHTQPALILVQQGIL